jgi:hypothetical protein
LDPDQVEELENQMLDYFQGRDFALNRVSKVCLTSLKTANT